MQKRLKLIGIDAKVRAQLLTLQYQWSGAAYSALNATAQTLHWLSCTVAMAEYLGFGCCISLLRINDSPVYCVQPPLNGIDWPTKKLLSCEAKNSANKASSRAVANRPKGTCRANDFWKDSFSRSSRG